MHQLADLGGDAGGRGVAGGRDGGGDEEQNDLAANGGAGGKRGADFGDSPAQELLVQLGQLARDDDVLRGAEDGFDVGERGQDAVGGFVKNVAPAASSVSVVGTRASRLSGAGLPLRQEAVEGELLGVLVAASRFRRGRWR